MRPQLNLRAAHAVPALGALAITTSLTHGGVLTADAAGPTTASAAAATPVQASLRNPHVGYGRPATVLGRVADGQPGHQLALQFEPRGGASWQTVATGTSGRDGAYRLRARLDRSGTLRVVEGGAATLRSAATPTASDAASSGQPVYVGAGIISRTAQRDVLAGRRVTITGHLEPLTAGAALTLQQRRGHRWVTLAKTTTGARGRYTIRFTPRRAGASALRLRYAGGAVNDASVNRVAVNVYRTAGASWYGPGGSLACGGTLTSSTMGVANKTLPCGTLVTLHYGHRTVRVPVIDRGPYVAGRDYDLTPATKAALGFGDTGTIWATR